MMTKRESSMYKILGDTQPETTAELKPGYNALVICETGAFKMLCNMVTILCYICIILTGFLEYEARYTIETSSSFSLIRMH